MDKRFDQKCHQNQYTDNKKAHEKIFNIFSDKGKYKLNS